MDKPVVKRGRKALETLNKVSPVAIQTAKKVRGSCFATGLFSLLQQEKNINIIYITNSLYKHLNNTINETRVNQTVLFNNVKLIETENKCKNLINNAIYLKESFDYTTNCSFIGYIKLFKQMGLKENRLEAISLDDNAKKITGVYQKINIVGLVTKVFPKLEEVTKYDYIYVLDDTEKLDYVNESEYLNDYNMNEIYKKVLDKPGNKFLMRK